MKAAHPEGTELIAELVKLQSKARALNNRLEELKDIYQAGDEDVGRIIRLRTSIEEERFALLDNLNLLLSDKNTPQLLDSIRAVQERQSEKLIKDKMEQLSLTQNWGEGFLDSIKKHKGDLVDLIITAAIKLLS